MIKTIMVPTFLSSLFLIIQTTWLKNGLFWGVIPDFAFLVILWIAYHNKGTQGVIVAFLSGLVCDLLSASPYGYFPFLYVLSAYSVSFFQKLVSMDAFFIPVLFGFAGTLVKGAASGSLLLIFGSEHINAYSLTDFHFWIEAALNGAIAPLVFWGLGKMRNILIARKPSE